MPVTFGPCCITALKQAWLSWNHWEGSGTLLEITVYEHCTVHKYRLKLYHVNMMVKHRHHFWAKAHFKQTEAKWKLFCGQRNQQKGFSRSKRVGVLNRPACSPDLSLIWSIMKWKKQNKTDIWRRARTVDIYNQTWMRQLPAPKGLVPALLSCWGGVKRRGDAKLS